MKDTGDVLKISWTLLQKITKLFLLDFLQDVSLILCLVEGASFATVDVPLTATHK